MTGRVVAGRYNLQHPIGRGAMGVVWRARDQLLDRDVAVKEVVISSLIGAEERQNAYQRTLREARTAARLSHRGVVAVYDVAEEDGRPWIIMELVPSRSLDQVLSVERRLSPLRTGRIGQQLLSALAAAHLAGVLHRDVKPSNVLIATDRSGSGWDERAVLTDFGIAQFEGDPRLTQTGMVMGSPGFTAPERIRGGDATSASDLWSLGATLYAAAEGRGPYEQRGGAITTMSAIINEDAPVAAHAGRLGPVIAALLHREPSARPSASAAARMFAQVLPRLAEATDRPHEPTRAATVRSSHVPQATVAAAPSAAAPSAVAPSAVAPSAVAPSAVAPSAVASPAAAAAPRVDSTPGDTPQAPEAEPAPRAETAASPAQAAPEDRAPEDQAGEAVLEATTPEATTPEADTPEAATPEADAPEAAAEPEVTTEPEAKEPEPELVAEAEAEAEAEAAEEPDADTDAPVQVAEAAEAPGESVEAGAAEDAGTAKAAVMVLEAAVRSVPAETLIDRGPVGYRPTERSIPAATPAPAPTFTASRPGERAAPTFSAARQGQSGGTAQAKPRTPQTTYEAQPGSAQHGGYPGTTTPLGGPDGQYAGPSQPHSDLSMRYTPGTGGGRAQRRRGPWRPIALVLFAAVLAAAIGAGIAFALQHHGGGSGTKADPTPTFGSVNALNNPSDVLPAGWTPERVTASEAHATAGFTIDVPPGWTEHRGVFPTTFTSPDGIMVLKIDLTPHTKDNMVTEARYIERQSSPSFTGYKRLHLQAVTVRSTDGAIWQFTRTTASGVTVLSDDILFLKPTPAGNQSYAVFIRAPSNGWGGTYLPQFDKILRTFQTLPAS